MTAVSHAQSALDQQLLVSRAAAEVGGQSRSAAGPIELSAVEWQAAFAPFLRAWSGFCSGSPHEAPSPIVAGMLASTERR
ncbi:MAG: hypothetical protein AAFU77_13590 [Myxococcota bacterium]